jgi:hypothetical protein
MALFEIIFELPEGTDTVVLDAATRKAGYVAQISGTDSERFFRVLIEHSKNSFEVGNIIAEEILQHLPQPSRYYSHRSSVAISELSAEEAEDFLSELENVVYGQISA